MINLKQLYDAKRKYYEAERVYGKYIYEYMRDYYNDNHLEPLPKYIGAKVEFKEIGKYSSPELVISSSSRLLDEDLITELCSEFNLRVTNKCVLTNVNESTKEITTKCRVYFGHNWGDENPSHHEEIDILNGITITYRSVNSEING